MNEIKTILTMVQELHNNQQRGRLAGLTEDSAILIDTADIAEMMNYSYSYTYNKIVCRPDFPMGCRLRGRAIIFGTPAISTGNLWRSSLRLLHPVIFRL